MNGFKKSNRKNVFIAVGVIASFIIVGIIFWPGSGDSVSNDKFIEKAKKDLKDKKAAEALENLKLVVQNDPDNEEAKKLLKEAKRELYNQAKSNLNKKKYADAAGQYGLILSIDPKNKDAKDDLASIPPGTVPNDPATGNTPGDGESSSGLKSIPAGAKPIDLLPSEMDGYRMSQNGWLEEPVSAGSTYLPVDPNINTDIDRIISTVTKFGNNNQASTVFNDSKSVLSNVIITDVNGHPVVIGYYEFPNSDLPSIASITWIRDQWYFKFDALPLQKTTSDNVKKEAALDVVKKFGY